MDKERKQLIVFGYGLAVILSLISAHIWRHHGWHAAHVVLFLCVILLVFVTALRYNLLRPFYQRWMKAVHFIGAVITGTVLSILFYLVFGIAGIILRLLGKDLLDQKMDPGARSYWMKKDRIDFNKEHYTRQF